jgi:hypothetical protein
MIIHLSDIAAELQKAPRENACCALYVKADHSGHASYILTHREEDDPNDDRIYSKIILDYDNIMGYTHRVDATCTFLPKGFHKYYCVYITPPGKESARKYINIYIQEEIKNLKLDSQLSEAAVSFMNYAHSIFIEAGTKTTQECNAIAAENLMKKMEELGWK